MGALEIQILGIIIAIAMGVLSKMCYDWITSGNQKNNKDDKSARMNENLEWLREMHAKTDSDGLPIWYVPRDLQKLAKENADRAFETNMILKDIKEVLKDNCIIMREVMREVQNLKK